MLSAAILVADRSIALGYRTWGRGEGVAQYALSQAGSILGDSRYTAEVAAFAGLDRLQHGE